MRERFSTLRRRCLGLLGMGALIAALAAVALVGSAMAQREGTSDLAISKADDPDPVHVGESLTYSIVVENFGPEPATDVTMTDFLPDDVDFVSATAPSGRCKERGGAVTCELGGIGHGINYSNVNYGAPKTVFVTVVPRRSGTITNRAVVKAEEFDSRSGNNEAITTTRVIGPEVCLGVAATLTGTAGADVLTGTAGADVIVALGSTDTIRLLGGNDLVCAGSGPDFVVGGPGADRVFAEEGGDRAFGGAGRDALMGGAGRDLLRGNGAADRLLGGAGRDRCGGGPGKDSLRGCER
jgi:uncharacterized repeat protein (TIGR01451 family)